MTMPTITLEAPHVAAIAEDLTKVGLRTGTRAVLTVRHYGGVLHGRVRANASGRGRGPRVRTGSYVHSIGLRVSLEGLQAQATVGTDDPRGRRFELGYDRTDKAGRTYHQRPRPHFGPAFDRTAPEFFAALIAVVPST